MSQPPLFPAQRLWRMFAFFLIAGALGFVAWKPKGPPLPLPGVTCLFHDITGLPCSLCGGTRAARAIMQGNFSQALHLNAAAFPAVGGMILAALILAWEALRGRAITNWTAQAKRYKLLFPIGLALIFIWWIPQMIGALNGTKKELIDLRNPIARALAERFEPSKP